MPGISLLTRRSRSLSTAIRAQAACPPELLPGRPRSVAANRLHAVGLAAATAAASLALLMSPPEAQAEKIGEFTGSGFLF